jgi:hypothetical protein
VYGRYLSTSAPGYSTALGACGGHDHDGMGYHYHAQVVTGTANGVSYPAYIGGPYTCWRGDISSSKIANFWSDASSAATAAYGSGRFAPTNLASRSDYENLKPCCGATRYFASSGVTLNGAGTRDTVGVVATPSYTCAATTTSTATVNVALIAGLVAGLVGGALLLTGGVVALALHTNAMPGLKAWLHARACFPAPPKVLP